MYFYTYFVKYIIPSKKRSPKGQWPERSSNPLSGLFLII